MEIGRSIDELEQGGAERAEYGKQLLVTLSDDLSRQFGRRFGVDNLELMRLFYQSNPPTRICESLSRKSVALSLPDNSESAIRNFDLPTLHRFSLLPGRIMCA
ncbi:MAG: DUF1016 N-terminal domain-containing protein [Syntrophobacteraceae bacterium]